MAAAEQESLPADDSASLPTSSPVSALVAIAETMFSDRLSVMRDQGDYSFIVRFKLSEDATAQFCISDTSDLMDVFLKGQKLTNSIRESFNSSIESARSKMDLIDALELTDRWWINNYASSPKDHSSKQSEKKKKSKAKPVLTDAEETEAAQGMKPAQAVISRVLWDENLPVDRFVVGYIDRFIGVIEKPFGAFCWQSFAEVDPETSAIPRHRIQYFKLDDVIVWDKSKRLDLIFGSGTPPSAAPFTLEEVLGRNGQENGGAFPDEQLNAEECEICPDVMDVPKGVRPNFYLSIPVQSPELVAKVRVLQQSIGDQFPATIKKTVDERDLHLTLCLFCTDDIRSIVKVLDGALSELQAILAGLELKMRNVCVMQEYRILCALLERKQIQPIINCLATRMSKTNIQCFWPDKLHLTLIHFKSPRDCSSWTEIEQALSLERFSATTISGLHLSLKAIGSRQELLDNNFLAAPLNEKIEEEVSMINSKIVGYHVRDAYLLGGLEKAVYQAASSGSKACAFFFQDPRSWQTTALLSDSDVERFQEACQKCDIAAENIVPHGEYILDLGSADESQRKKSQERVIAHVKLCHQLGIRLYNFHPGAISPQDSMTDFVNRLVASINLIIRQTSETSVRLLLETAAGQNNETGRKFEEIRNMVDLVEDQSRIGVCLDTCHVFAAGYDLRSKSAYEKTMAEFGCVIGFDKLGAVHLNDSKGPLGCCLDRHEVIGKGRIGVQAFDFIMNDARFDNVPMILETPFSHDYHLEEMQLLHSLQQHSRAASRSVVIDASKYDRLAQRLAVSQSAAMEQLSSDIQAFCDEHSQKPTTAQWKQLVTDRLQADVAAVFGDATIEMIGGSVNGLGSDRSDIDLALLIEQGVGLTWQRAMDTLRALKDPLKRSLDAEKAEMRAGLIPILRLTLSSGLQLDINCNQMSSIQDSNLLRAYADLDPAFPAICLVVKAWAQRHGLNVALNGYLNNYCIVLLVLHYLHAVGRLPCLNRLVQDIDWKRPVDRADLIRLAISRSTESSLAELLIGFFAYFVAFDFHSFWISIAEGEKRARSELPEDSQHFLVYIEDPFEKKNTSRCVLDEHNFNDIRLALASTCDQLMNGYDLATLL